MNSYYNVVSFLIAGTTVKVAPHNQQWLAIQTGFDRVETASKSSLKVTGYSSSSGIAATPDSFLMLNASGTPYASATLSFAPNFGGFKAQNLGDGVSASDAITYGQAQTLINTAAYGSPTVVSLPSLSGNALKTLRVNAGGVATEWVESLPAVGASQADLLITKNGAWVRAPQGQNLLADISRYINGEWYLNTSVDFSPYAGALGVWHNNFSALGDLFRNESPYYIDCASNQAYTFSADVAMTSASPVASSVRLFIRYYNASLVQVGSETVADAAISGSGVFARPSVTATAPATAVKMVVGAKATVTIAAHEFSAANLKIEAGSTATPYQDTSTNYRMDSFVSSKLLQAYGHNSGATAARSLDFWTTNSPSATVRLYARVGFSPYADPDKGALDVFAKRVTFNGIAGYNALVANGALGATPAIDFMAGAKQSGSLSANAVITLTAPPSDIVFEAKLYLQQDATGSRTATFASSATIKHVGGSAKAPQAAANSETCYNVTWDGARFIISGYDL